METLVAGVKHLVMFAIFFPQAFYTSLMMSLQQEWQFSNHVTRIVGTLFASLEEELRNDFLLDLLGGSR